MRTHQERGSPCAALMRSNSNDLWVTQSSRGLRPGKDYLIFIYLGKTSTTTTFFHLVHLAGEHSAYVYARSLMGPNSQAAVPETKHCVSLFHPWWLESPSSCWERKQERTNPKAMWVTVKSLGKEGSWREDQKRLMVREGRGGGAQPLSIWRTMYGQAWQLQQPHYHFSSLHYNTQGTDMIWSHPYLLVIPK